MRLQGNGDQQAKLMRRYLWVWGLAIFGMAAASLLALINFNG